MSELNLTPPAAPAGHLDRIEIMLGVVARQLEAITYALGLAVDEDGCPVPATAAYGNTPVTRDQLTAILADPATWTDLLTAPCEPCQGSGYTYDPAWREWHERGDRLRQEWEASQQAGNWYDSPGYYAWDADAPQGDEEHPCRACHTHGRAPTPAGRALLTFVRDHS